MSDGDLFITVVVTISDYEEFEGSGPVGDGDSTYDSGDTP